MNIGVKRNADKYESSPAVLGTRIVVKRTKDTGELDPEPSGRALTADRATQFDSSRYWAAGGEGSCLTQGMMCYRPPAESCEGGMS